MIVVRTLDELRAVRARRAEAEGSAEGQAGAGAGTTVGFVPTMGALHAGHASLVRRAVAENDLAVASIFVNPKQFDDAADLAAYPHGLERDAALLEAEGCAALFAPDVTTMYPPGFQTTVSVADVAGPLEGAGRPGHFDGVATVVLKLLNMVQPTRAYFGMKDAQQLAVVRRMVRDLDVPVRIVACPTVREPDGLALSSRNARLGPVERAAATVLFRALDAARGTYEAGERSAARLRATLHAVLASEPLADVEYASVADPTTMAEIEADILDGRAALLSLAVRIGPVRLIDNVVVGQGRDDEAAGAVDVGD